MYYKFVTILKFILEVKNQSKQLFQSLYLINYYCLCIHLKTKKENILNSVVIFDELNFNKI